MVGVRKGAAQQAAGGGRRRRHLTGRPAWRRRDSRAEVVGKVCGGQSRGGTRERGRDGQGLAVCILHVGSTYAWVIRPAHQCSQAQRHPGWTP